MSKLTPDEIYKIAKSISESKVSNKKGYYKSIYKQFYDEQPILYEMCCEKNFDISVLEYMLDMLSKMQSKEITTDQASVDVGQKLFNKYVDLSKSKTKEETNNNISE